jgi:hypothetical protein
MGDGGLRFTAFSRRSRLLSDSFNLRNPQLLDCVVRVESDQHAVNQLNLLLAQRGVLHLKIALLEWITRL